MTFTLESTAPEGSEIRPRMRPPVPWAARREESERHMTRARHTVFSFSACRLSFDERRRGDTIGPPEIGGRFCFCLKATAFTPPQPCYNPARLENRGGDCQG